MLLQNRDVSPYVAGAKQWEDQNGKYKRKVKDGETPMSIFAPEQNKIYINLAKIISSKLQDYLNNIGNPIYRGDVDYLAGKLGIDNYYAKHFLGYSLFMGGNNLSKTIEFINNQIRRFSKYGNIYYGKKTGSNGQTEFKTVEVYDISQTEPTSSDSFEEPSRDVWMSNKNEPDSKAQALTISLVDWAKSAKYQVGDKWETGINVDLVASTGSAGGWSSGGKIAISEMSLGWRQFSTVIHEVAHSLLHFGQDRGKMTSQQKEIEAESTAFVVLNFFGFTDFC